METALMALGRNPWFNQKGSGGVMTKHILSRKSMEKPAPPELPVLTATLPTEKLEQPRRPSWSTATWD